LALNTEKAHNLKERSLEVIRMYRGLVGDRAGRESEFAALFEEPAFITLGASYEKRPRYSGGAYHPLVKRMEAFFDLPLAEALRIREKRADKLLELDDKVVEIVNQMKAKGLVSPYLKNFVVARLNFLRFKKEPTVEFDSTLAKMLEMARKFNIENVKREDVVRMGGGAMEPEADE
jgi:ParB family chromosome partitioning protein